MASIRPYTIVNGDKVYIVGVGHSTGEDVLHFFGQSDGEKAKDVTCPIRIFLRNFFGVEKPTEEMIRACAERLENVPGELTREINLTNEEVTEFRPNDYTDAISSISEKVKDHIKTVYLESKGEKTFKLRSFGDKVFRLNPVGLLWIKRGVIN